MKSDTAIQGHTVPKSQRQKTQKQSQLTRSVTPDVIRGPGENKWNIVFAKQTQFSTFSTQDQGSHQKTKPIKPDQKPICFQFRRPAEIRIFDCTLGSLICFLKNKPKIYITCILAYLYTFFKKQSQYPHSRSRIEHRPQIQTQFKPKKINQRHQRLNAFGQTKPI